MTGCDWQWALRWRFSDAIVGLKPFIAAKPAIALSFWNNKPVSLSLMFFGVHWKFVKMVLSSLSEYFLDYTKFPENELFHSVSAPEVIDKII